MYAVGKLVSSVDYLCAHTSYGFVIWNNVKNLDNENCSHVTPSCLFSEHETNRCMIFVMYTNILFTLRLHINGYCGRSVPKYVVYVCGTSVVHCHRTQLSYTRPLHYKAHATEQEKYARRVYVGDFPLRVRTHSDTVAVIVC